MGFIGVGEMGGTLARNAAAVLSGSKMIVSNRTVSKAETLSADIGCAVGDNVSVAEASKFIVLGVKPQGMGEAFSQIAPVLEKRGNGFVLVSMAAGLTISDIRALAGGDYPVIRIMPNTPCAIGRGVILVCRSENVTDEDYAGFTEAMKTAGECVDFTEDKMDAGCALSGCGPAFVYTFIDAFAKAGAEIGIDRETAITLSSATVMGAADMMSRAENVSPEVLRDAVCSPGGATIEGVKVLEGGNFREIISDCVKASYNRTLELGGRKK